MADVEAVKAETMTGEMWNDRKATLLLAHVPEPILLHGGRAGWKRTVFFSHTYRSQYTE